MQTLRMLKYGNESFVSNKNVDVAARVISPIFDRKPAAILGPP